MTRLPKPGGDDGQWGNLLNDFLSVEHTDAGTLRNVARPADVAAKYTLPTGGIPESDLSAAVQTKLDNGGTIADGSITAAKLNTGVNASLTKADNALAATALDSSAAALVTNGASATGAALNNNFHQIAARTVSMPSGLGWSGPAFTATVQDLPGGVRSLGTISVTPKAAFDAASTARTSPGAEFYVAPATSSPAGSDSNSGSSSAPFASIWKAVQAANSAGVPTRIYVEAGVYDRAHNAVSGGGVNVYPLVDTALIAKNGRVITGTFDSPGTPSLDATFTNCYAYTLANAERVHDIQNPNRFGNHTELINVASPTLCNITPGSWVISAGKMYIHRNDGAAVTAANTRVYRSSSFAGLVIRDIQINVYVGGRENNSGFDLEGGTEGAISVLMHTAQSNTSTLAVENSTFKYGGGTTSVQGKAVSIETWNGLVYFSNCRADASWTDGFNFHNTNGAAATNVLTLNCTANDNGRGTSQSCNGWTSHEAIVGIDISGYYVNNHGGTCRSINNTKSWLAGTAVVDDLGDLAFGGVVPPTAFRVDDNAVYWLDRARINMPAATFSYYAYLANSAIHLREPWPSGLLSDGGGTINTY